jgi:hypothetical protein
MDVACALLYGLWGPNPRVPPPAIEVLARLGALRPQHRTEPDAEYSYALAMSRVAEDRTSSPEASLLARRELDLAAKRGTGDSALDKSLYGLRQRLVPRPARTGTESRVYAVSGSYPARLVVHDPASGDAIAEVLEMSETGSMLTIRYRKIKTALSNIVAMDALEAALLTSLVQKESHQRISSVEYVDEEAGFRVTAPYPE